MIFKRNPEYAELFASQAQVRLKSALDVVWSNKEKGLFIKKVSEVASGVIAIVDASMSIKDVAHEMRIVKRSSTAVVCDNGKLVGLMTDRDMTKRVIAEGHDNSAPISEVMTPNPLTISPNDLVLHAASLMMQHNVRGLPVVSDGKVVGLLTTSHLVQNHRMQAIFLIEKIKYATSIRTMANFTIERQAIFEALVEGNVAPETIGRVMSMIMDAYNRRIIQIAIDKLGEPPCQFSWIVAGSHARNEVHMLSDQDNALRNLLSDPAPRMEALATEVEYLVLDFETTGLDANTNSILSLGWVEVVNFTVNVASAKQLFIESPNEVKAETAVINHIMPEMLQDGISLDSAMTQLFQAAKNKILIAHGSMIEAAFVDEYLTQKYGVSDLPVMWLDTLAIEKSMALAVNKDAEFDVRLSETRKRYGLPEYNGHEALIDAIATAELFLAQSTRLFDKQYPCIGKLYRLLNYALETVRDTQTAT